ncbi:MAG: hypothetical protein HY744_13615 [Deltaproteobacteria bacterium]|nr:hypothetical protein [Deltaproteobacteria bacterium]
MRTHTKIFALAGLLVATPALAGCGTTHRLLRFEENADRPVMLLETRTEHSGVFSSSIEHVFWSCVQQGAELRCKRQCGGETDLRCPQTVFFLQ